MGRKPSLANLRDRTTTEVVAAAFETKPVLISNPASRQGRKQIAGFLPHQTLIRRQDRNLQALMTKAFNDVLRKHGESPIGD